jgi:hypothetical protein
MMPTLTGSSGGWHSRGFASILAISIAIGLTAFADTKKSAEILYLLGETARDRYSTGSGLYLYGIGPGRNLKILREIVPPQDPTEPGDYGAGVYAVRDDMGDKIYVAYPSITPSTLSVIHKENPAMKDEVEFNPHNYPVLPTDFGIAAGDDRQSFLLCTLLQDTPAGGVASSLIGIAGDAPAQGPRILNNDWEMFNLFRFDGAPGGEAFDAMSVIGYVAENRIRLKGEAGAGPYKMKLDLGSVPPFPIDHAPWNTYIIVAVTARYFAFVPVIQSPEEPSQYTYPPYICVHDRERNTWKKLTFVAPVEDGGRIFGPWLATDLNVTQKVGYPWVGGGHSKSPAPGTLVLDNLEDGRRIDIEAGNEDSEVLAVRGDGLVLYRVKDAIFAARIDHDRLGKPSLVVQDEGVSRVHWVFWSE